ncbi:MAG: hypothetical protein PHD06_04015 [Bacteroidales bacterium]|nr:hypothetical protein [Bacteroidales bacterium]MDY0198434.1 hypothetical protein [Tenuifilaceae bacterium]
MRVIHTVAILFFLMHCQYAFSQKLDYIDYVIKFNRTLFVTSDTTYKLKTFVKPNGQMYYEQGFGEPEDYKFYQKKTESRKLIKHQERENYIDTIQCKVSLKKNKVASYDSVFPYNEIFISKIFNILNEPDIRNSDLLILRIVVPCQETINSGIYNVIRIVFDVDLVVLHTSRAQSLDYNGYQILSTDSTVLTKKYVRRLTKQLEQIKNINEFDCVDYTGNYSWLVEINKGSRYRRFFVETMCSRYSQNPEVKELTRFYMRVLSNLYHVLPRIHDCAQ